MRLSFVDRARGQGLLRTVTKDSRMDDDDWYLPDDEALLPCATMLSDGRSGQPSASFGFDDDDGASVAEGGAMLLPLTVEDAEGGGDRVAPFLVKLYEIVSSESLDQHVSWSAAGDTLRIVDPASFARDVLPLYFKHSNLRSFIRQLNMYGFCRGPTKGSRVIEFFHERFCRGGRAHLRQIKRCQVAKPKAAVTAAAAAADPQAEREMRQLVGELDEAHHSICRLEGELMGYLPHYEYDLCAAFSSS
mmetsp:Transcript_9487/g.22802  ORF Transcript_9487/g.22802 Transcript_9487/m.22802 type:complete len:247 (+) Transcript_9487:1-741(+)